MSHSTVRFFADDTLVSKQIASENDVELLQEYLENIINWSKCNNMMLHEHKFDLIVHKYQPKSNIYELPFVTELISYKVSSGEYKTPTDTLKDLCITVSSSLSWDPHINIVVSRARSVVAWALSALKPEMSQPC